MKKLAKYYDLRQCVTGCTLRTGAETTSGTWAMSGKDGQRTSLFRRWMGVCRTVRRTGEPRTSPLIKLFSGGKGDCRPLRENNLGA